MKKIYIIQIAILSLFVGSMFTACSNDTPFSTAAINDDPRILDPVFPDRNKDGSLPVIANINRDSKFSMKLTVTPADFTTVTWYVDGMPISKGDSIDTALLAGTYNLKVTATTDAGKSTYREGIIQVNPLNNDPSTQTIAFERYAASSQIAHLYGNNLALVKSMSIGGENVTNLNYVESSEGEYLEYEVPKSLSDGDYRIILKNESGSEYGGELLHVISAPLVTTGANRATSNTEWVISGVNMNDIASLSISDKTVTQFSSQTASEVSFICPSLSDGDYILTGKTKTGGDVKFYVNGSIVNKLESTISTEKSLWSGHHYVSWELPDGNPNKTFNFLGSSVFSSVRAGSILKIHYSLNSSDKYHQIEVTSGFWTMLPGTKIVDLKGAGLLEVTLTQDDLNLIAKEGGFLCVGHGYYVDNVTLK